MSNVKLNYKQFKDMDDVFTAGMSPIDMKIRQVEAGWKAMFTPDKVSNHQGKLINMGTQQIPVWNIWQMTPQFKFLFFGKDTKFGKGDLKIHPLSIYLDNGFCGQRIVCIKRCTLWTNDTRKKGKQYRLQLWQQGKTEYDWTGCRRFQKLFSKLKDKPKQFYCSQLCQHTDQQVGGFSIAGLMGKNDDITPWGKQKIETRNYFRIKHRL